MSSSPNTIATAHAAGSAKAGARRRRRLIPDNFEAVQLPDRWHRTRPNPNPEVGERLIPLPPWMVAALHEWRENAEDD